MLVLQALCNLAICALMMTIFGRGICAAQTDRDTTSPQAVDEDFSPQETLPVDTDGSQTVMNLQTGAPLRAVLSPLHWGHLSLVSASASQGYDSNPNLLAVPQSSRLEIFSALAVYSRSFNGSTLDAQYHPFLLFSSRRSLKDLGAASFDFVTEHPLSRSWSWRASDFLRYSPNQQATVEGRGFVFDTGGGVAIGNAFLSSGRNFLENNVIGALRDQYSQQSFLDFHVNERFGRLSGPLGQSTTSVSTQEEFRTGAGVTWSNTLGMRDTVDLRYDYSIQSTIGSNAGGVRSHTLGVSWEHYLTPTLSFTSEVGPIWSTLAGPDQSATTRLQGALQLRKIFNTGGVAVSFSRSDNFSGLISNSVNNRYDISIERRFRTRWSLLTTASYVQQQQVGIRSSTGTLASTGIGYSFSRNWSLFVQGKYLDVLPKSAPEKLITLGVTWSWVPDKP